MAVDNHPITADKEAAAPRFKSVDCASQSTHSAKLSVEELTANPKMLQYYTGLDDYIPSLPVCPPESRSSSSSRGLLLETPEDVGREPATSHPHQAAPPHTQPASSSCCRSRCIFTPNKELAFWFNVSEFTVGIVCVT